jgi:hypothetical protein
MVRGVRKPVSALKYERNVSIEKHSRRNRTLKVPHRIGSRRVSSLGGLAHEASHLKANRDREGLHSKGRQDRS